MSDTVLTDEQRAAGCWVCDCGDVRMVWDFCGVCRRLSPDDPTNLPRPEPEHAND